LANKGYRNNVKAQRHTILVVDDDPNDLLIIEHALRRLDTKCRIQLVHSGQEAITYLNGTGKFQNRGQFGFPGYIITDLKMRDGNGFDLLQFLKSNPDKCIVPVIVLSGSDDTHDVKQAYALGASVFLVKPAAPEALRQLLRKVYDLFSECEVPEVSDSGKPEPTAAIGKIRADPD
jgi:CheY-like chemotaxis protein